jgi:hypothetical protein
MQHNEQRATCACNRYHNAPGWWKSIVTLQGFFMSPNLVWLTIAVVMYLIVPYDLDRSDGHGPRDGWDVAWMAPRFVLNCSVTMLYVTYWSACSTSAPSMTRHNKPQRSTSCCMVCDMVCHDTTQYSVQQRSTIATHCNATPRVAMLTERVPTQHGASQQIQTR